MADTLVKVASSKELNLTRSDVVEYLSEIDRALPAESRETVVLVGGAYLALRGLRKASDDIDSAFVLSAALTEAGRRVTTRRGEVRSWLNDSAQAFTPPGLKTSDCQELLQRPHLRVLGPTADVVFAMKVNASRPQDLIDMALLWPLCTFFDAVDAAAQFYSYYPDQAIDPYLTDHIARALRKAPWSQPEPS